MTKLETAQPLIDSLDQITQKYFEPSHAYARNNLEVSLHIIATGLKVLLQVDEALTKDTK